MGAPFRLHSAVSNKVGPVAPDLPGMAGAAWKRSSAGRLIASVRKQQKIKESVLKFKEVRIADMLKEITLPAMDANDKKVRCSLAWADGAKLHGIRRASPITAASLRRSASGSIC